MRHLNIGLAILVFLLSLSLTSLGLSVYELKKDGDSLRKVSPQELAGEKVIFNKEKKTVQIGDKVWQVEVADTPALRTHGLSDRDNLVPGTGMLFIFDQPDIYHFWMKDMHFPIDIIWISEDWQVVSTSRNLAPSTYPQTFAPSTKAQYILETNPGELK